MADRERRMEDHPPNSRLFVIHGKTVENRDLTEDTFKEAFGKYGTVEDVWILKARGNKTTGQLKGNARCLNFFCFLALGLDLVFSHIVAHVIIIGVKKDMNPIFESDVPFSFTL